MDKNKNPWITTVKGRSPTPKITTQTFPNHPTTILFAYNTVLEEGLHYRLEEMFRLMLICRYKAQMIQKILANGIEASPTEKGH